LQPKAIAAADPAHAEANVAKELDWQSRRIAKNLGEEALKRVIIQKKDDRVVIKIQKGNDF
jgi:hypothetical protein